MGNPNTPAPKILTVKELHEALGKVMVDNPERAEWPVLTYIHESYPHKEHGAGVVHLIHESKDEPKFILGGDHPFESLPDRNAVVLINKIGAHMLDRTL